jgi:hypothetical protein
MEIFQISKLENPIALGMGIGTQPNFIDALIKNNHGLTLPNKMWRGQLAFQWTFIIDRCLYERKGEGGQQNTCLHIRRGNVWHVDGFFF